MFRMSLLVMALSCSGLALAQNKSESDTINAVLLLRVAELEATIAHKKDGVEIYVMGPQKTIDSITRVKGAKIGKTTVAKVHGGMGLPAQRPDILFVATGKDWNQTVAYLHKHKVLSMTDRPDLFHKGLSVGLLQENRRPKIALNPAASLAEGLDWRLDMNMLQSLILEFKSVEQAN